MVAPAKPEQLLWNANHIVVAQVIEGISTDIRHRSPGGISPKDTVQLTIKIEEVIQTRPNPLPTDPRHPLFKLPPVKYPSVEETIELGASVSNIVPRPSTGPIPPPELDMGRIPMDPPTGQLLSDDEIKAAFVGKKFVFAIRGNYYTLRNPDVLRRPPEHIVKYHATIWPLEKLEMIKTKLGQMAQRHSEYEELQRRSLEVFNLHEVSVDLNGQIVAEGQIRFPPDDRGSFTLAAHDRICFRPSDQGMRFEAATAERDCSGFMATRKTGLALAIPASLGVILARALRDAPEKPQRAKFSDQEGRLECPPNRAAAETESAGKAFLPRRKLSEVQLLSDWDLVLSMEGDLLKVELSAALFGFPPAQAWKKDQVGHWSTPDGTPLRVEISFLVNSATRVAACQAAYVSSIQMPIADLKNSFRTTLASLDLMSSPIDTMGHVYGMTKRGEWMRIASQDKSVLLTPYSPRQRRTDGFLLVDQSYREPSISLDGIGMTTIVRMLWNEPRRSICVELREGSFGHLIQGREFNEANNPAPGQFIQQAILRFEITLKGLIMFYRLYVTELEIVPEGWKDGWIEEEIILPWEIIIFRYPQLLWHRKDFTGVAPQS
jgi:hypothetical protein